VEYVRNAGNVTGLPCLVQNKATLAFSLKTNEEKEQVMNAIYIIME